MAIRLNMTVANIAATLAAGYTHLRIYRSAEYSSGFSEITTTSTLIELLPGVSAYSFLDGNGTTEHWYRSSYVDTSGVVSETSPSASFAGDYEDTNFVATTYPSEAVFTNYDFYVIDKVRNIIGDPRELTRDYISSSTSYSDVSTDGYSLTFSNPKGWPLKVTLDGQDYISKDEPRVNDYQFLTFSGTTINTTSGTLDVWYYHFRNSDTEVLRTFNGLTTPVGLTAAQVTFDLSVVLAGIELLEKELRQFSITSGSKVDIYEEIGIDPSAGITSRMKDLADLRARKDELIDAILVDDPELFGVLID